MILKPRQRHASLQGKGYYFAKTLSLRKDKRLSSYIIQLQTGHSFGFSFLITITPNRATWEKKYQYRKDNEIRVS